VELCTACSGRPGEDERTLALFTCEACDGAGFLERVAGGPWGPPSTEAIREALDRMDGVSLELPADRERKARLERALEKRG
jgi:hypothetical protein